MATISMHFDGDGVVRLMGATDALAGTRKHAALRRALNHTGRKCFTRVKRALVKQMGLSSQKIFTGGRSIVQRPASGAHLEFQIVTFGGAIRAKEFRHSVSRRNGVTFYPWGVRHHFGDAFRVPRFGGNLYRRTTEARFPLEALYGPNLSKELVKDASAAAFHQVAAELPRRIAHEITVITNGVVS